MAFSDTYIANHQDRLLRLGDVWAVRQIAPGSRSEEAVKVGSRRWEELIRQGYRVVNPESSLNREMVAGVRKTLDMMVPGGSFVDEAWDEEEGKGKQKHRLGRTRNPDIPDSPEDYYQKIIERVKTGKLSVDKIAGFYKASYADLEHDRLLPDYENDTRVINDVRFKVLQSLGYFPDRNTVVVRRRDGRFRMLLDLADALKAMETGQFQITGETTREGWGVMEPTAPVSGKRNPVEGLSYTTWAAVQLMRERAKEYGEPAMVGVMPESTASMVWDKAQVLESKMARVQAGVPRMSLEVFGVVDRPRVYGWAPEKWVDEFSEKVRAKEEREQAERIAKGEKEAVKAWGAFVDEYNRLGDKYVGKLEKVVEGYEKAAHAAIDDLRAGRGVEGKHKAQVQTAGAGVLGRIGRAGTTAGSGLMRLAKAAKVFVNTVTAMPEPSPLPGELARAGKGRGR